MSENGVMDRPRRSTRNSLASASSTPAGTPSSNPYKKPTYSGRGANETPTSSRNTNGTPTRGRRGRGRPPGRPSSGRGGYSGKPECMAVRADGRRSTGGSTTSSAGGGRRGAATSGGRRSTYSSRHEYEYHYGSDFDSDQNDSEEVEEDEIESDQESEHDSISLSPDNDSDSDFSVTSSKVTSSRIPSPPVPIWLDTDKVPDIPSLELPCSSDDLLLPSEFVVKAAEIYEPLRRFYQLVRLSPFRFEDFCAALANEDQSSLLAEIHIQLLRSVIREEDANGTLFGPNEVKDSIAAVMFFVDPITWPETIRSYLESDPAWKDVYEAMTSVEYPFCGPSVRLKVLTWLVDQFLTTQAVRETVLGDGTIFHDDHCRACNRMGELICCESCPAVYHFGCLNIKDADDVPNEWKCSVCVKHQVPGVSDCQLEIESDGCLIRHERLGYDRHGRKYWFLVRRIIVESEDDSEVWYYSTRKQIEELLSRLDASNYEQILVENLRNIEEEIYRHCEVTEEVTTLQNVSRRKTYLDAVNGKDEEEGVERMTRNKATGLYKLGHENLFKTYVNHFNTDPLAVGKGKNEERDRKRHLSHKFSLTTASECKYGIKDLAGCPRQIQINALRGALMNMETLLPTTLMHVNWPMLRKNWIINVTAGSCALDFSRAMIMISACIRNAVYNPVWSESTGHVRFSRSSLAEREERKKLEKMDKKGKDDEDDRLKGEPQYTKNPLPIRHQVYKQKGEEYRVHGRWGWIWLSKMRRCKPEDCREKGLLAGPHKHVIQVKNEHGKVKTMLIDPSVYCKLMAKRNLTVSGSPATPVKSAVNGDCDTTIESGTPRTSTEEKSEDGKSEPENVEDSSSSSNKENADDVEMKDALEIEVSAGSKKNTEDIVKIDEDMEDGKVVESSKSPVEPKTEPMETDVVEEEKDTAETVMNGVLSCEEGSLENKVRSPEESKKEEVVDTESPMQKSEVEKPVVNGVTDEDSKEDHEVVDSNKVDGQPDEGTEESQTGVTGSGGVTSVASADNRADDSQNRKFRTELINVCNGISSSHRILYPKVARRSEFLDSLLQRRLTLTSLEERNLKNTYGEETVAKARPGLAQFEAEEKRRVQEADEYPGEEVVDDNLTLGGAYAYCCYSSECRKEALEFMKTKGKNRERIYEKICYSPMCRLKFCLQETTRFKQERLREIEKEKYLKTYKEIEEKRHYTLEGTSQKVSMKKIADCVPVSSSASTNGVAGAVQLNKKKSKIPAVKYPQTSSFQYASSKKPSILVLAPWELSKLARTSGRSFTPSGFFQNQKSGSWGWTYPCGRPTFRTAWQFKASHSNTMAAAAMQLRILYASIRWDDILTKIPYTDGRNQVHTDTEIITSEILNHRIVGRFMERVQYLRRMHVVPIDAPKTIREVTPSRHGLRKRKRAEIPDQTDPVVTEDWVDEEKLELWEIRFYGDRIDKKHTVIGGVTRYYDSNTPSTRTKSGIAIKQPEKYDPSPHPTHTGERKTYSSAHNSQQSGGQQQTVASSSSSCSSNSSFSDNVESTIEHVIRSQDVVKPGDSGKTVSAVKTAELMRETLETEMKMQRAVQFSKRDGHVKKGTITSNGAKPTTLQTPTASQQFQMQQKSATGGISPSVAAKTLIGTPTSSKVGNVAVGKKFFSNRQSTGATAGTDGPILTKRPLQNTITINKGAGGTISVVKTNPNQQMAATTQAQAIQGSGLQVPTTVAVATLGGQQPPAGQAQPATAGASVVMPQQKLSVVRLPDGRLQVKGLLPGQHCYQTPDGKIHVTVSAAQVQLMQQQQQQLNAARTQQAIQGAPASVTTGTPSSNEQPVVTPNAEENVCATTALTSPSTPVITSTTTMANEVAVSSNGQQPQTPATTVAQQQPHIAVSQPVTQGVIQMPQTTQVVVSSQQNQQPVINIGNQAVKSSVSNSTGLVATTATQSRQGISIQQSQPQVMIQQPNGQHLLIQGHAAQALLQQHKLNTSQRTVLQGSVSGQQLIKQVTTAGGQQIALKSPVVVQTSTGPTVGGIVASTAGGQQVTGRIVIQDGKAVLIGAASVPTSQQRIVVNQKQVVQTTAAMVQSPQQQTIARPQVIQTSAGTTMQLIQSGQGLHLITQQTPTPPPEQIIVSGSTTSVTSVNSTESTTSSPVKSNASGTGTSGLSPSTITTAVRHVLPDGRTVLMSPGQLNDLGGRKVVLAGNKVIQIPTGAGATIQGTQQQIIQGLVGANAGAGTLQLVQGPGGQQFYIQSGPTSVSSQLTAGVIQQQQQVQIVVPGGQIGSNQPLLVKKLVKAVATPSTLPQAQVAVQANSQAPTPQPAVQQAVSSEGSTESQMASNQVTNGTSVVTQSAPSPQQQTLITRTPGLPISIVSPSKGKVPSPNQQGTSSPSPSPLSSMPPSGPPKTGTVLRVSSPATNTPQTSVLKQSGTSQIMYTPPVTPTKSATKMVSPEAETERTAVNISTSDSLGPSTVSTDTPSQPISVAPQGMLQNTAPIASNHVNPVPTNSTALLTPSNTQSQSESGSQGNHTSLAEAQPTALRSTSDTSSSPLPPTEFSPKHTIQADNSTGNKITAKIFSTASGPKVVIQGINPDELTPSQLAQLQQQINRHWAAQQRMQGVSPQVGATATGATVSAPAVMLPASSAVVHPSPSNVQSSAAAAGLSQQPASVSLPSILQKSQSGNASYAGSANVAQHLSPTEVLRASSSLAVSHAPTLSSPPPPRMLSPATVRSPPGLSLATTPVQPGVVVRKSQARKSPIRPNNLDSPPPLVSPAPTPTQSLDLERQNHGNNDDVELTRPLNTQQQQELDDRRNSLKEDIMEKKKQAATQMRLEAQRGIQEKLQKQKAIELANSKAEEQKRVVVEQHNSVNDNSHKGAKKRKYETGPGRNSTDQDPSSASTQRSSLQRRGPGSRGRGAGKKKKKHELYCICKTPYDDSKFYVGCDKCCNWYHGDCVGITQDMSKNLAEYICDDCREDDDNKLYCMCKKPYNESQFYIQCDKCEDWFHGRCVGVLQGESDYIGDYSCPGCEPNSDINLPNGKKLDAIDFAAIARLLKELLSNRLSLPFRKPVSKSEAPNYRSVIKEPMDLQTISNRVEARQYERLREFIGDVGRIFENCRYFNDSTTDIFRNADNLEKIFVQKINALRENLSSRAKQ